MVTVTVPSELRTRPQWLLWRYEERDGKPTKVPYRPADPSRQASTADPATWASFEQAVSASSEADGIGFVFSADDPFVGVDIDHAVDENGEWNPEAAGIVARLDSYTERSPSGRGLHVIVKGSLNGSRRRTGDFEVYDAGRYFTVTGERVGSRETVEERQRELDDVLARIFPSTANGSAPSGDAIPDDRDLLDRAFRAANGAKVEALYRGEIDGYASPSEADLALCSMLAFWTGPDPDRLDRLFRGSGLAREKWDSARGDSTYGAQTIDQALRRSEFHELPRETPPTPPEPARDGGHDPEAAEELADLLGLPSVGQKIVGARIIGPGSRASADLYLSNGTEINFESLREVAHPTRLAVEITACTGATPALKAPMAQKALALLRRISERRESFTRDQIAFDWGATYLQSARTLDVDMGSREDRWRAFSEIDRIEPRALSREQGVSLAHAGVVLAHTDGSRFVRTGWFFDYARTQDVSAGGNAEIAARMERVGWHRRGGIGRIKATRQGFPGQLAWSFFEVPAGWEDGR